MSQSEAKKVRYKMGRLERKNTLVAYSFLAPNFIGFAVFTLVPVLCAIALSFFEWNGGDISKLKFVGLDNYATIFATKKVAEGMDKLAKAINEKSAIADIFAEPYAFPRALYIAIANINWNRTAKANGLRPSDLYRRL